MSVTRPRGKQLFDRSSPNHFVHQTDHAVHVKIGLTVRTHRQKLRFKPIISAGGPDLIDSPPLTGTVAEVSISVGKQAGAVQLGRNAGGDDVPNQTLLIAVERLVCDAHIERGSGAESL